MNTHKQTYLCNKGLLGKASWTEGIIRIKQASRSLTVTFSNILHLQNCTGNLRNSICLCPTILFCTFLQKFIFDLLAGFNSATRDHSKLLQENKNQWGQYFSARGSAIGHETFPYLPSFCKAIHIKKRNNGQNSKFLKRPRLSSHWERHWPTRPNLVWL